MAANRYLTWVNGVLNWLQAISVSAGVADANKIVATSSNGKIDPSLLPASGGGIPVITSPTTDAVPRITAAGELTNTPFLLPANSIGAGLVRIASQRIASFETHFLGGIGDFNAATNGTGSTNTGGSDTGGRPGVLAQRTGSTSTGRAGVTLANNNAPATAIQLGFGAADLSFVFRVPNLSNATDRFTVRIGFTDSNTGDATDGVYLRYADDVNSGQWQIVNRDNSTETVVNTTTLPQENVWQTLRILVAANASVANFFIDGVAIGSITGISATRQTSVGSGIFKSLGVNSRSFEIDYLSLTIYIN